MMWILPVGVIAYLLFNNVKSNLMDQIFFGFGGVDIDSIGRDGIRLKVLLKVVNHSATSFPIDGFEGVIYFKDKELAPIKSAGAENIKAKASTNLGYIVAVGEKQLKTVFGSLNTAIDNIKDASNKGNYRLKGKISVRLGNLMYFHDIDQTF
jgi:LEA14-like dessication related protein